ncbi:Germinal-center associated nuclear protein [Orchesella cincta]|uniref:Germinal-center associated nuclear protein n=1 Tax=Orchesella cincta TaxID=48709 RepID=A0A1D2NEG9_ORCCI|nr:Germinal-center associated nuclear protein [Orchesella cincta]
MESSTGDDASKKKSIVVVEMLEEFINRDILKKHFEKYGTVERLACSVSKRYAVIHFSTAEEADYAMKNGKIIKENAPPLKIFKSAKAAPTASQAQAQAQKSTSSGPPSTTRVVLRRKLSRTPVSTSPTSELPLSIPTTNVVNKSPEPPSTSQLGPLRSSIKVSRPSPFLRKRPSLGDRTGKSGPPMVSRNPFALPPRNMLTLDRRKEKISPGGPSISTSDLGSKSSPSIRKILKAATDKTISVNITLKESEKEQKPVVFQGAAFISPEGGASTTRDENDVTASTQSHSQDVPELPSSLQLDADENTEDVTETPGIESGGVDTNENDGYEFEEGDAGTQDTAEATTEEEEEEEEEGEILDDEDNDNEEDPDDEQDEEDDDDVYESPMKRFESEAKAAKSAAGGGFSFKLSKDNNSSSGSLFKLPFTSPFSLGDAPKPFSSASFGGAPKPFSSSTSFGDVPKPFTSTSLGDVPKPFTSTSFGIKVSASSGAKPSLSASKAADKADAPKEKQKEKPFVTPASLKKNDASEMEKAKPFPFGIFSSAGGSAASSKPVAPIVDVKSSIFSAKTTSSTSLPKRVGISAPPPPASIVATTSQVVVVPSTLQTQRDVPNPLLLSFNPDTPEAQELFSKRAVTVEERYRILEARDKIIRSRVPKTKVNVEEATRLIGTCPDMCPEKERYMRQFQRQLVGYETLPGPDVAVDHQRAIKVYSRSSADQEEPLPHELRPGPTLDYTMNYLLQTIVPLGDNPDDNLSDWYHFLWDRTRSIRKDITQQQIIDLTAVSLYEKCTRFHIHCGSRLCELDVHSFDPKLNDENLMKCLQSLEHLYEDLRRRQVTCPNEPEFRAYQIMMNLNEGDALYNAQQLPSWILNSTDVQIALKLHHNIYTKNFVAFFKSVEGLPYMTACILHRYFFQVRSLALRCLMKAYCTLPKFETSMPMSTLQRMLGYGLEEAQYFNYLCEAHGIHCDIEDNKVILKRKMFYLPEFPSIYREKHLIDSKLRTSVAEAVNGGPLPNIDFGSRIPQSSFNENGQLIPGDIVGSSSGNRAVISATISQNPESTTVKQLPKAIQPIIKSSFPFARVFQQRKETPPAPVLVVAKPEKEIDAACQAVTARLIDESIKQDIVELSEARLAEAKKNQEIAARKKLREEVATRVAQEFIEKAINQHVENVVRSQTISRIRQFVAIEEASKMALESLVDETVLINTSIAARTELILAKELHHRQLRTLKEIFARVRARFAFGKWSAYTRRKKLERELQQEKRREELWNFPAVNSYSLTTKDVYNAFCGRSSVQPSINKVDSLVTVDDLIKTTLENSPDSLTAPRAKRRSGGDSEIFPIPAKLPKLSPDISPMTVNRLRELWEFPAIDSYSRTNRQVLEAFCGSSVTKNSSVFTSSFTPIRKMPNFGPINFNKNTPFFRPIGSFSSDGRYSKEIQTKSAEGTTDMLKSVQNFLSQVREETQKLDSLETYQKSVDDMRKTCPLIDSQIESASAAHSARNAGDFSSSYSEFNNPEWMEVDNTAINMAALNFDNDDLLNCIQRFVLKIREEKAKSWNVDTFLNDIEVDL